jgi:hypothetical protein
MERFHVYTEHYAFEKSYQNLIISRKIGVVDPVNNAEGSCNSPLNRQKIQNMSRC